MTQPTVAETKPVAELKSGDWIDLTSLNDRDLDFEGPAVVRYAETFKEPGYREPHTMVMFGGVGQDRPWSHSWPATTKARLLTETEREAVQKQAERAERIADMRRLVDWLEQHPELPVASFSANLHLSAPRDGTVEANVARVRAVAAELGVKADEHLDDRTAARVEFGDSSYYLLAWHEDGRPVEPVTCNWCDDPASPDPALHPGDGRTHVPADDLGYGYSREQDDPTPVSPARGGPVHTGGVVAGGQLVDETPAEHYEASIRTGPTGIGDSGATCACGTDVGGFDTVAEAQKQLAFHIEAATSPTGLTPAADLSRGPLAGTSPVVTYFSFGHGQTDPGTGQKLIDHYVTVVAPTYEECREAMLASRFGHNWSWDYLAGRAKTTEAVSQWTEHEVIVAPGTDQELAKSALKAAGDLLFVVPVSESR